MNELSLSTSPTELKQKLLTTSDSDELKNIIDLFNLDIKKKNLVRIEALNELQDLVYEQLEARLLEKPGDFSNKDLLEYFKVFQTTIDNNSKENLQIDVPMQIVQNNVTVNVEDSEAQLSRASRAKVLDVVRSIIGDVSTSEFVDVECEDVGEQNE